ncbi:MAG: IS1096 element passenger TnpR family protein [Pseudonocardiaceae bacterium]
MTPARFDRVNWVRPAERFTYEYNFFAGWQLDLRVEQIADPQPGRTSTRCVGGRRAGPPEGWGRAWEFGSGHNRIWCSTRSPVAPGS